MTFKLAIELDQADVLAHKRQEFKLDPKLIYLDGNSLGALPLACIERARDVVETNGEKISFLVGTLITGLIFQHRWEKKSLHSLAQLLVRLYVVIQSQLIYLRC